MRAIDLFAGAGGEADECWTGVGSDNGNGYRCVRIGGRKRYVHRLSWEHHVGPIPPGAVIDHLCRNRECWNPGHLEPVTNAENILRGKSPPARNARKSACPKCNTPYAQKGNGDRYCRACHQRARTDTKRKGIGRAQDRTHCPHGHPYDEENTYLVRRPDGSIKQRMCRECGRNRVRARRAAERR